MYLVETVFSSASLVDFALPLLNRTGVMVLFAESSQTDPFRLLPAVSLAITPEPDVHFWVSPSAPGTDRIALAARPRYTRNPPTSATSNTTTSTCARLNYSRFRPPEPTTDLVVDLAWAVRFEVGFLLVVCFFDEFDFAFLLMEFSLLHFGLHTSSAKNKHKRFLSQDSPLYLWIIRRAAVVW